jgi:hypothetical protein
VRVLHHERPIPNERLARIPTLPTNAPNYTTCDDRDGSMSDVIQRTDERIVRDATRTTRDGATHTRSVVESCDKDVGKCVKQVEAGKEP